MLVSSIALHVEHSKNSRSNTRLSSIGCVAGFQRIDGGSDLCESGAQGSNLARSLCPREVDLLVAMGRRCAGAVNKGAGCCLDPIDAADRKSTRLNSSH